LAYQKRDPIFDTGGASQEYLEQDLQCLGTDLGNLQTSTREPHGGRKGEFALIFQFKFVIGKKL